jgi:hypothetical protein
MSEFSKIAVASLLTLNACSSDPRVKLEDLEGINPSIVEVNNKLEKKYRDICPEEHSPGDYLLVNRKSKEEIEKYIRKNNTSENRIVLELLNTKDGFSVLEKDYEDLSDDSKRDSSNIVVIYHDIRRKIEHDIIDNEGDWIDTSEVLEKIVTDRDKNLSKAELVIHPGKNSGWVCDIVWGAVNREDLFGNEDYVFSGTEFETYVVPATPEAYVKYFENR